MLSRRCREDFSRRRAFRSCCRRPTGYPVIVKQFLQFCLILIYPAWVFAVLAGGTLYFVLWALLWPLRAWMKANHPQDYEASKLK